MALETIDADESEYFRSEMVKSHRLSVNHRSMGASFGTYLQIETLAIDCTGIDELQALLHGLRGDKLTH